MFRSIKRVSNDMQLATCYPTCTRYAKRNFPPLSEVPLVLTSYAIRLIRRLSHIALCQSSLVAVCRWSCSPWRRHSQYIANIQNVKHLGKEIFEKLGARRSRCAKSLVGEEAQKWALPRLWAWTRKCGRAHFLRPCPRDLGAQHESVVRVHSWAHVHPAGSTIMGDHTCTSWATKAATYWALTNVSTLIHVCPRKLGVHTYPHTTTAHLHHRTPSTTRSHKTLGAQLQDGVPRFGQPWTATICSGPPRSFGRPRHIMAVHETLDVHTLVWSPIKFVDIHAIVWTSSARLPWAPTKFYGRSHIHLDGHENLWTLRRLRGCPKCRRRWTSTHIHGCPMTATFWAPNYASNFTHFGRPLRYGWSPTFIPGCPRDKCGLPRILGGLPQHFVGIHVTCVAGHGKYVEPHAFSWVATKSYGSPRHNRGRAS